MKHYIYILTNKLIHDKEGNSYVKIGITDNIERRRKQLQSTGVPAPFELFFGLEVDSKEIAEDIENRILEGMSFVRYSSNREFLQINPEDLKSILQIAEIMGAKAITSLDELELKSPQKKNIINNKSYPSLESDVIICSGSRAGFENAFFGQNKWWGDGGIRIAESRIKHLKYIAIYITSPDSSITHYGKIKEIVPDERPDKSEYSEIRLEEPPKQLENGPLHLDSNSYAPQDRVYTDSKSLFGAKTLSDVIPRKNTF